ncbi:hypothetical protein ACFL0L_05515 [Patescibacteria group bacterium]
MLGISFSKKEFWFVSLWAVVLVIISFIPHIVGFLNEPEGQQYMMTGYPIYQDSNTYFTWIRQAAEGSFLFEIKYTHEPHIQALFQPVFLVMGLLIRIGLPLMFVWFLFQAVSVIFLTFVLYIFFAKFLTRARLRRYALVLVSFAGGFGFLIFFLNNWPPIGWRPVDVELPEATIGRSIMWPYIFAFSIALLLLSFLFLARYLDTRQKKYLIIAGLLGFVLNIIHPYDMVTLVFVSTVYVFIRYRFKLWKETVLFLAIVILPSLYHFWLLLDPIFGAHSGFNMRSPVPLAYLIGFGALLPLMLVGMISILKRRKFKENPHWFLLGVWVLSMPILLYAPIDFQRRLVEGVIVAVVLFAIVGMVELWQWIDPHLPRGRGARGIVRWGVLLSAFIIITITPIANLLDDVKWVRDGGFPYYFSDEVIEGMEWLEQNTSRDDVVLTTWGTGNFIPRLSGNTVFLGHGAQTINAYQKHLQAESFFSGAMSEPLQKELLHQNNISYIFSGPYEQKGGEMPDNTTRVFQNADVLIYHVNP